MILLDKIKMEIENLTKLKEILEKTETESNININCKFENEELDKIFIEGWEKLKIILMLKGLNIKKDYSLSNYVSIYENRKEYITNGFGINENVIINKYVEPLTDAEKE